MEPDEIGKAVYDEVHLSPFEPAKSGSFGLARRLGMDIYEQPRAQEEATLAVWSGAERIVLRKGMQIERANFLVAQMIARVYVRSLRQLRPVTQDECVKRENLIAAWLVAPPIPFAERYDEVGPDIGALAEQFKITHTTAVLRLTEVPLDRPYDLVVVPANKPPIRRASGLLGHLPDADLRVLARKRTRSVRKVQLRDDGASVALMTS